MLFIAKPPTDTPNFRLFVMRWLLAEEEDETLPF